jgi:hypothetical protein
MLKYSRYKTRHYNRFDLKSRRQILYIGMFNRFILYSNTCLVCSYFIKYIIYIFFVSFNIRESKIIPKTQEYRVQNRVLQCNFYCHFNFYDSSLNYIFLNRTEFKRNVICTSANALVTSFCCDLQQRIQLLERRIFCKRWRLVHNEVVLWTTTTHTTLTHLIYDIPFISC